jgi:hypothetical protein
VRTVALVVLALAGAAAGGADSEAPAPASVAEAIAAGDAHYARRAEGARGGTALPFHPEGAMVEYRRALALDPLSLGARLGLMRAIFFRTGFCGEMDDRDKVRLLDEAKKVGEQAVAQVESAGRKRKGKDAADPVPGEVAVADVYLWAAVSWGQWAVYHHLSAAWQGAPKRIRDLAESVIAIDPAAAQHGAFIILGRLHCEAPRVMGLTGWVSCEKGLAFLRQGLAQAPDNQALAYFLADELLRRDPTRGGEALGLLRRCAASTPRPEFTVEDAHYAEEARERLAGLR